MVVKFFRSSFAAQYAVLILTTLLLWLPALLQPCQGQGCTKPAFATGQPMAQAIPSTYCWPGLATDAGASPLF